MTIKEAVVAADTILIDEANELALLVENGLGKGLPHRAKIAIQREIRRLREIAVTLKTAKFTTQETE